MDLPMAPSHPDVPLWQQPEAAQAQAAAEGSSSSIIDEDLTVGFAAQPQVQVGKPESSWRYEMRREAQLILPNLYLGGYQSSRTIEGLQVLGITHIVCVREATEAFLIKPRFPDHFEYLVVEVADTEDQNLIRIFPSTYDFISRAIAGGGTVLVHCSGGIALAPSIVCGYVMLSQQATFEEAVKWTQQRRYCMSLNLGFLNQLREYEAFCRASLALPPPAASSSPGAVAYTSRPRKRDGDALDGDDDDDAMDDSDAGHWERRDEAGIDPYTGLREHRPERRVQRRDL